MAFFACNTAASRVAFGHRHGAGLQRRHLTSSARRAQHAVPKARMGPRGISMLAQAPGMSQAKPDHFGNPVPEHRSSSSIQWSAVAGWAAAGVLLYLAFEMLHSEDPDAIDPRIDVSKLQYVKLLGKGGNCEAWLCTYEGVGEVVAKIPDPSTDKTEVEKMMQAAKLHKKFNHEHILKVLGVYERSSPPVIVLEYVEGGDMDELLGTGFIDQPTQWRLASEVARAMQYLHEFQPAPYSHRDIKPMNVFLTKDRQVRLADFDFLVEIPEGAKVDGVKGSPGYLAPEMVKGGYDHRTDIWSYASLLYELTHAAYPFSKEMVDADGVPLISKPQMAEAWIQAVKEATVQGVTPVLDPRKCPPKMMQLITDCWAVNPEHRPTAAEIVKRLDDMKDEFEGRWWKTGRWTRALGLWGPLPQQRGLQ
uniref:Protein kinase domain-containing protein n=1 Tax=Eutreptiella gymnastica TaxID=73025 RepID=A0A7S4G650_9EUGL